jgi:hypothetical protein
VGPHCSFCGAFTGPFSEIEGLFTVLICIPCLEVRLAQPDTLRGFHDPGRPGERWGCPIKGWTATYQLLRPYPNQLQPVVYRRNAPTTS